MTVAAEPPLDVAQFEVAVKLWSFTGRSEGCFEEMTANIPAFAFLVHSLSSVDYSSRLPGAAGLQWPEMPGHAALCKALARSVLFSQGQGGRMTADFLRRRIGGPSFGASVRVLLDMKPRAISAAMELVTLSHFVPKKAMGNVCTFTIMTRKVHNTTSVIADGLDCMRGAAAEHARLAERRKRAAEGDGGGPAAAKRPHFGPR